MESEIKNLKVPETVQSFHPLVEEVKTLFLSLKGNQNGPILKTNQRVLAVEVSASNLNRGLRILDTVVKQIEKMNGSVIIEKC